MIKFFQVGVGGCSRHKTGLKPVSEAAVPSASKSRGSFDESFFSRSGLNLLFAFDSKVFDHYFELLLLLVSSRCVFPPFFPSMMIKGLMTIVLELLCIKNRRAWLKTNNGVIAYLKHCLFFLRRCDNPTIHCVKAHCGLAESRIEMLRTVPPTTISPATKVSLWSPI